MWLGNLLPCPSVCTVYLHLSTEALWYLNVCTYNYSFLSCVQFFTVTIPSLATMWHAHKIEQTISLSSHTCCSIVRSGDAIYVRVGDHDLTRKYGSPGAQTLRVATTYIHHNHNSQTLDNDIALLKLHGQAELKDGVCLVCLPARGVSQAAGKRCTVTGYGYMGEGM